MIKSLDQRLLLEFLPGLVFLVVNAVSTLFVATGAAILAAMLAVFLRYRIDRQIPFIAISTVALSVVLFGIGLVMDDERYIKIKSTIGGTLFACILLSGLAFRPSLLQRSLGYRLDMLPMGWTLLHLSWAAMALLLAAANELVWRNSSTDTWVAYNVASGPVAIGLYWAITWCIAWYWWNEVEDGEADGQ